MSEEIVISVRNKVATTEFREAVSFNSGYKLKFDFDEEWADFRVRSAVAVWAGGFSELLFEGDECNLPTVASDRCESVLIGVYAVNAEARIASSFVRLYVKGGAHGMPRYDAPVSFQEQVFALLNAIMQGGSDVEPGVYSSVEVDGRGYVVSGGNILEIGEEGASEPDASLAEGGLFFACSGGSYTPWVKTSGGLTKLKLAEGAMNVPRSEPLVFGKKSYNGSESVKVSADDIGAVRYDVENQPLTVIQKSYAQKNIGLDEAFARRAEEISARYVSVEAGQSFDPTQKAQARRNIGAGTSDFSGKYSDLTGAPADATDAGNIASGTLDALRLPEDLIASGEGITVERNGTGKYTVSLSGVLGTLGYEIIS